MLLNIVICNGSRNLIEINSIGYDREDDSIWAMTYGVESTFFESGNDDEETITIDSVTLSSYSVSVLNSRLGVKESRGNVVDIYHLIEQELYEHGKVYIELYPITK